MIRFAPLIALAGILLATRAAAVPRAEDAFVRFAAEDKCVAQSVTKFPNRDAVSQHQRDNFVDDCLSQHGLPPRAHIAAPLPPQAQMPARPGKGKGKHKHQGAGNPGTGAPPAATATPAIPDSGNQGSAGANAPNGGAGTPNPQSPAAEPAH